MLPSLGQLPIGGPGRQPLEDDGYAFASPTGSKSLIN